MQFLCIHTLASLCDLKFAGPIFLHQNEEEIGKNQTEKVKMRQNRVTFQCMCVRVCVYCQHQNHTAANERKIFVKEYKLS